MVTQGNTYIKPLNGEIKEYVVELNGVSSTETFDTTTIVSDGNPLYIEIQRKDGTLVYGNDWTNTAGMNEFDPLGASLSSVDFILKIAVLGSKDY